MRGLGRCDKDSCGSGGATQNHRKPLSPPPPLRGEGANRRAHLTVDSWARCAHSSRIPQGLAASARTANARVSPARSMTNPLAPSQLLPALVSSAAMRSILDDRARLQRMLDVEAALAHAAAALRLSPPPVVHPIP